LASLAASSQVAFLIRSASRLFFPYFFYVKNSHWATSPIGFFFNRTTLGLLSYTFLMIASLIARHASGLPSFFARMSLCFLLVLSRFSRWPSKGFFVLFPVFALAPHSSPPPFAAFDDGTAEDSFRLFGEALFFVFGGGVFRFFGSVGRLPDSPFLQDFLFRISILG